MVFILSKIYFRYNHKLYYDILELIYSIEYIIQFFLRMHSSIDLKSVNFFQKKIISRKTRVRNNCETKTLTVLNANLDPLHAV